MTEFHKFEKAFKSIEYKLEKNPEYSIELLIKCGICNKNGELTESYR